MNEHTDNNEPTYPINPNAAIFWVGIAALFWLPIITTTFWASTLPNFIIEPMYSFVNWTGLGILLPCLWFIFIAIFFASQKINQISFSNVRQIAGALLITAAIWGAISNIHFSDFNSIANMGNGPIGGNIGLHIFGGTNFMGWIRIILIAYTGTSVIKPSISTKSWQLFMMAFWILGLALRAVYNNLLFNRKPSQLPEKIHVDSYVKMPPEVLTPHIKESSIMNPPTNTEAPAAPTLEVQPYSQNPIRNDYQLSTTDLLSSYISTSNVSIEGFSEIDIPKATLEDILIPETNQNKPNLIPPKPISKEHQKSNKYWSSSPTNETPRSTASHLENNQMDSKSDLVKRESEQSNSDEFKMPHTSNSWNLPSMKLLSGISEGGISKEEICSTSEIIKNTFAEYKVEVEVEKVRPGPTVTMYGIQPGWVRKVKRVRSRDENGAAELDDNGKPLMVQQEEKTRVSVDNILRREKDLSLALKTPSLRIETPVMGESLLGIEVPNPTPTLVALKNVMESATYSSLAKKSPLPVALGKGSDGEEVSFDLSKMPHLLIAGATGSGKSVCINAIISGLIMEKDPSEMQMLLIDPKRVELTPYNGIPHLITPVIVETEKVVGILKGLIQEMMNRYRRMEEVGVRNISSFNDKGGTKMPYLVVAIDELADLMMTAAFDVEQSICRLAQLGRATGIHLIVATQRPSVDVITGLIKANFPSRISFAVTSQIDSRTILDTNGAERLLGKGDMLYQPIDATRPTRVQNVYIGDEEISDIVQHWASTPKGRKQEIDLRVTSDDYADPSNVTSESGANSQDELFEKAMALAQKYTKLSTSLLQRRLRIGYPRAARLMDELEDMGVVGPSDGSKSRDVISTT
ncbi:DNA translocase FtsK [Chloroflexi bacterium]|nr:DNA translocase FtsK [Chloroflexota bacterium]